MSEKLKAAAQQALEALCRWSSGLDVDAVALNDLIDELDAALAEQTVPSDCADSHQPVAWMWEETATRTSTGIGGVDRKLLFCRPVDEPWKRNITPLYTATPKKLEEPEPAQEPVAWMYTGIKSDSTEHGPHLVWKPAYMDAMSASKGAQATPLYTAPPHLDEILREFVRLTRQRDALLEALKEVILDVEHEESDGYMSSLVSVEAHRLAQAAIKLVRGEEE